MPHSYSLSDPSSPHLRRLWQALERDDAARLGNIAWGKRFLPHRFPGSPADFHLTLDSDLRDLHTRRGSRIAVLAPRDGAKTTVVTLTYALRCAVEAWEPYILLLSDSGGQALKYLADLRSEVESNQTLRSIYPDACSPGGEWRDTAIRLGNGVLIEAMGSGARIRGRRNRQHRPSLIVVDDPQGNQDITSPTERQRAWDWFTREVIPAGGASDTNFVSVGTALHRDAIAVKVGTLPGWTHRTFQAVHSWPERGDLWDEWERLATNLADFDRHQTAAQFHLARASEMDQGAVTYWPERWPIQSLMLRRAEIGRSAFDTEYQQNPSSPVGAEWPAEYFDFPGFWFDQWPALRIKLQTLDPSKGTGSKSADYQAHIFGGLGSTDGIIYLDAELRREADYVSRALDIAHQFAPAVLIAESNNTMGLLEPEVRRQIQERTNTTRAVKCAYQEVVSTQPKLARIRYISPYLQRRQVRVRNSPGGRMLVDQWRDFPNGDHDDAPDAVGSFIRALEEMVLPS